MEKKVIRKLSDDVKGIKVIGQAHDCMHDCKQWQEVSGANFPVNGGMLPCYQRICRGYYYYNAFWSKKR